MHYVIFSCSPQAEGRSTSTYIAQIFKKVLNAEGDFAECYSLCHRNEFERYRDIFEKNENILFVTPLYTESVPGLFLEFLESLSPKSDSNTTISFVIQGGFEEASQYRTAEKFLKQLPAQLHCRYGKTLIKGGLFGLVRFRGEKLQYKITKQYEMAAKAYRIEHGFTESFILRFAGAEYYSKSMILLAKVSKPLNRIVWNQIAKKLRVRGRLSDQPYSNIVYCQTKESGLY